MQPTGGLGYYLLGLLPVEKQSATQDTSQVQFWPQIVYWLKGAYKEVYSTLGFVFAFKFHGIFLASLLQVYLINEAQISLSYIGFTYKTGGMLALLGSG